MRCSPITILGNVCLCGCNFTVSNIKLQDKQEEEYICFPEMKANILSDLICSINVLTPSFIIQEKAKWNEGGEGGGGRHVLTTEAL